MKQIKNVIQDLLISLDLPYSVNKNGCYEINLDGLLIICEVVEEIRVFKFYAFNGIEVPENRKCHCLTYLNSLTNQWDALSFFLSKSNHYVICSSGCALGYELKVETAQLYLSFVIRAAMDNNINREMAKIIQGAKMG